MKFHLPGRRSHKTNHICIDTRLCEACWTCIEICPNDVLGKIDLKFHRHARIDAAERCTGCAKCVQACPHGAISRIVQKKPVCE
jgi:2-oxoglutarate ferredoxin oxidoreductase subunit delta